MSKRSSIRPPRFAIPVLFFGALLQSSATGVIIAGLQNGDFPGFAVDNFDSATGHAEKDAATGALVAGNATPEFNFGRVRGYYAPGGDATASAAQSFHGAFEPLDAATAFPTASALQAGPLGGAGPELSSGITGGIQPEVFFNPTVEHFDPPTLQTDNHDFGNGMVFTNLDGDQDYVKFQGSYGLGDNGSVTDGIDNDGFFGTLEAETTFQFAFPSGVVHFGFYGTESFFSDSDPRDGVLHLGFYGVDDSFLGSIIADTNGGAPFDTFYGFQSDGILIGKVVFEDAGHIVLDDVTFSSEVIPEPSSVSLLALGILSTFVLLYRARRSTGTRRHA